METTAQVVSERRLRTLSDLGRRLGATETLEECGESAIATFRDSAADMLFALLYLRQDDAESLQLCGVSRVSAHLQMAQLRSEALARNEPSVVEKTSYSPRLFTN